jgi:hypothetical protein
MEAAGHASRRLSLEEVPAASTGRSAGGDDHRWSPLSASNEVPAADRTAGSGRINWRCGDDRAARTADSGGENQSGNKYVSVSSDSYRAVRRLSTWTDSSSYVKVPFMRPSASGRLVHVMSRNRYVPPVGNVIVASPVKVNTDSVNVPRTGTRKR